eukprot:SAG31_NODE_26724_length_437_cov_1.295858_2_plen_35_part_01
MAIAIGMEMSEEDLMSFFAMADKDHDGSIDVEEFA